MTLIGVQYLQNVVSSFGKDLNGQNHSSDSHHLLKNFSKKDSQFPSMGEFPSPQNDIWKTLRNVNYPNIVCIAKLNQKNFYHTLNTTLNTTVEYCINGYNLEGHQYAIFYREVHSVKFTRLVFIYKYIYLRNNNLWVQNRGLQSFSHCMCLRNSTINMII